MQSNPHNIPSSSSRQPQTLLRPRPPPRTPLQQLRITHKQYLRKLFIYQLYEFSNVVNFTQFQLPLECIEELMKADEDVQVIAPETVVLLAKVCELFILDTTLRSWFYMDASKCRRKCLMKIDIDTVINETQVLDFLRDIVVGDRDNAASSSGGLMGPPPPVSVGSMKPPPPVFDRLVRARVGSSSGGPNYYPPIGYPSSTRRVLLGMPGMNATGLFRPPLKPFCQSGGNVGLGDRSGRPSFVPGNQSGRLSLGPGNQRGGSRFVPGNRSGGSRFVQRNQSGGSLFVTGNQSGASRFVQGNQSGGSRFVQGNQSGGLSFGPGNASLGSRFVPGNQSGGTIFVPGNQSRGSRFLPGNQSGGPSFDGQG